MPPEHRQRNTGGYTKERNIPGAVAGASLAGLNGASELLATPLLNQNIFPAVVQDFLDSFGNIDNARSRYKVVIFLDVAVIELLKPEAVGRLAIFVRVADLHPVPNLTLASQRCQGTDVGVHCCKHDSRVVHFASNIPRAIIPIDAQRINWLC